MINVDAILNRNLDPRNVIWRHYQTCLSPELEVKTGILEELLMSRDDNNEHTYTVHTYDSVN